jgi:hypothetical protein
MKEYAKGFLVNFITVLSAAAAYAFYEKEMIIPAVASAIIFVIIMALRIIEFRKEK